MRRLHILILALLLFGFLFFKTSAVEAQTCGNTLRIDKGECYDPGIGTYCRWRWTCTDPSCVVPCDRNTCRTVNAVCSSAERPTCESTLRPVLGGDCNITCTRKDCAIVGPAPTNTPSPAPPTNTPPPALPTPTNTPPPGVPTPTSPAAPTPTSPTGPTPTPTSPTGRGPGPTDPPDTSYCDACGYCYAEPNRVPSDWQACRDCLYPGVGNASPQSQATLKGHPTPYPDHYYTMIGCLSTVPGEFTSQMTKAAFSLIGGVAFLALLYGAFVIATSRGDRQRLNYGKRVVYGAVVGLLFVLLSTFLIRFVASDILKIPGFE